jgi:hypothetical protein
MENFFERLGEQLQRRSARGQVGIRRAGILRGQSAPSRTPSSSPANPGAQKRCAFSMSRCLACARCPVGQRAQLRIPRGPRRLLRGLECDLYAATFFVALADSSSGSEFTYDVFNQ